MLLESLHSLHCLVGFGDLSSTNALNVTMSWLIPLCLTTDIFTFNRVRWIAKVISKLHQCETLVTKSSAVWMLLFKALGFLSMFSSSISRGFKSTTLLFLSSSKVSPSALTSLKSSESSDWDWLFLRCLSWLFCGEVLLFLSRGDPILSSDGDVSPFWVSCDWLFFDLIDRLFWGGDAGMSSSCSDDVLFWRGDVLLFCSFVEVLFWSWDDKLFSSCDNMLFSRCVGKLSRSCVDVLFCCEDSKLCSCIDTLFGSCVDMLFCSCVDMLFCSCVDTLFCSCAGVLFCCDGSKFCSCVDKLFFRCGDSKLCSCVDKLFFERGDSTFCSCVDKLFLGCGDWLFSGCCSTGSLFS